MWQGDWAMMWRVDVSLYGIADVAYGRGCLSVRWCPRGGELAEGAELVGRGGAAPKRRRASLEVRLRRAGRGRSPKRVEEPRSGGVEARPSARKDRGCRGSWEALERTSGAGMEAAGEPAGRWRRGTVARVSEEVCRCTRRRRVRTAADSSERLAGYGRVRRTCKV